MNSPKTNPDLARFFDEARDLKGLSIFKIAARTGLHPNTITRVGYGIATTRTLNAVARVLGVTVDELTGRKPGSVAR